MSTSSPIAQKTGRASLLPEASGRVRRKRTVATRVLFSFSVVTLAFSLVVGWAVIALGNSAREAVLMRDGYLPLALALRDAVASQDIWNTQLNHVTTAKNPADQRAWFDLALRGGRPKTFAELGSALTKAFSESPGPARDMRPELSAEASDIEHFMEGDRDLIARLFEAIDRDDDRAEQLREQLVTRGHQAKRRLSGLEQRVQHVVDSLIAQARTRERRAMHLLVGLAVFTALVGAAMALYARRVLSPLAAVTERAEAVARGDLTPREPPHSDDEIGELATTFEGMVSAIARANAELVATERLATIGKMAAHVTHEIRNPLSSLALNVELLEEELGDGMEAKTLLRAIKTEVDRLTALSERYLSVARRKPPKLELEEIGDVCREALDSMKRDLERHGITATLEVDEDVPQLYLDEAQIRQALYNLLRNAREAMPAGGRVLVAAKRGPSGSAEITIDDEGEGIDEETRARLFEPFFTTKGHGTGLGLVITREIVEAHGGEIRCEPRAPKGTRFVIRLPGQRAPLQPDSHSNRQG